MIKNHDSLAERLRQSDPAAEEKVITSYLSRLDIYFRMRIKGEPDYNDLIQEVFTSFFQAVKRGKIQEDAYIGPFIYGIAKRVMFNFFHNQKRTEKIQRKGEHHLETTTEFTESRRLEIENLTRAIQGIIDTLSPIDQRILREHFLEEKSIGEVADLLEKTNHYVSVRKERALKKIKNEMARNSRIYNV